MLGGCTREMYCYHKGVLLGGSVGLLKWPPQFQKPVFGFTWRLFYCGQYRTPHARARARREFCIVYNGKVSASVGLLKVPQKFHIQFLELHGDFSIVDNTELATRARARVRARGGARVRGGFCIVSNRKVGASVGLLKGPQKFQIQFLELHGGFSIVDDTELRTRAWRVLYCPQ